MAARRARETPRRGALRVVAGVAGGLRLDSPGGTDTRPTSDRVREAIFNSLASMGAVEGGEALDAYAGSGALGIEALSRGSARVTFVETDAAARAVITANLAATGLADRAVVQGGDGARAAASGPWDLVLLDPPYAFEGWDDLLRAVAGSLVPTGVAVVESDRELVLPEGLHATRVKRYGGTVVTFATTTGAGS